VFSAFLLSVQPSQYILWFGDPGVDHGLFLPVVLTAGYAYAHLLGTVSARQTAAITLGFIADAACRPSPLQAWIPRAFLPTWHISASFVSVEPAIFFYPTDRCCNLSVESAESLSFTHFQPRFAACNRQLSLYWELNLLQAF
jgi:hypothetical protein